MSSGTHAVGEKLPNGFGAHDMHGNVWEWCWDLYDAYHYEQLNDVSDVLDPIGLRPDSHRVLRGGYFGINATFCRSALRYNGSPDFRALGVGFRLAMTIGAANLPTYYTAPMMWSIRYAGELKELDKKIERDPEKASNYAARSTWYARQGKWHEASIDSLAYLKLSPNDRLFWQGTAALLLLGGDHDEYEKLCQRMISQFQRSENASDIGKVCAMVPTDRDFSQILDRVMDHKWNPVWSRSIIALVTLRSGDVETSISLAKESLELPGNNVNSLRFCLTVLALAYHASGDMELARNTLARATPYIAADLRTLGPNRPESVEPLPASVVHFDTLVPEVLRREAVKLIISTGEQPTDKRLLWAPYKKAPWPSSVMGQATHVYFTNLKDMPVQLIWVEPKGTLKDYGFIKSGATKPMRTNAHNCWLIKDEDGKSLGHFIADNAPARAVIPKD